jgi:hypothetical protein
MYMKIFECEVWVLLVKSERDEEKGVKLW